MKKIKTVFTLNLGMILLIGIIMCPPSVYAESIKLNYQAIYPERHVVVVNAIKPWFEKIKELTNDELEFVFFPPGAIVKQPETFDAVKMGLVDLGGANTGRNPGKFSLNDLISLPLLFPNATIASEVIWTLHKEFPEWRNEFNGTHPLWQFTSATNQIMTKKKQIKSLEDLRGLKIIGWTPAMIKLLKVLGANPIQIPPPETYLALERGVADGIATAIPVMRPYKLNEVTKYITIANITVTSFYIVMNSKKMKDLPPKHQKALNDTTGVLMAEACGKALDDGMARDIKWLKKEGFQFHTLSPSEQNRWVDTVIPMRETWLKEMEKRGYKNVRNILERAKNLKEKIQQ